MRTDLVAPTRRGESFCVQLTGGRHSSAKRNYLHGEIESIENYNIDNFNRNAHMLLNDIFNVRAYSSRLRGRNPKTGVAQTGLVQCADL